LNNRFSAPYLEHYWRKIMTKLDELRPAAYSVDAQQGVCRLLTMLIAMLSIALLSSNSFAQDLSLNLINDLVPSTGPASREIPTYEFDSGAYDQCQIESLENLGRLSKPAGEHQQALVLFYTLPE